MSDRRSFLETLGAAALAAIAPRARPSRDALDRIGLQLYTVRGEMEKDFESTLARVAQVGYDEVEFAGYFGRSPDAVKQTLARVGLAAPSTHLPLELLGDGWARALADAGRIGHRYVVIAWVPAERRRTLDDYKRLADLFNRAGREARAVGLRFAYHNHDFEFASLDGQTPYDVLLAATDPAAVELEMDLYWVVKGGADPLAYFARLPGRFPMVHVKDAGPPPERRMADVGKGVIDFRAVFAQRRAAGIEHYFVEHDQPQDPLASIRASYDYLKHLTF